MATKSAKRPAKPTAKRAKPTAAKAAVKRQASPAGTISVNELCAQHKLNSKMARAKLRRKFGDKHEHGSRWRFTPSQARDVLALIRG